MFVLCGIKIYDDALFKAAANIASNNPKINFFFKTHPILPKSKLKVMEKIPENLCELNYNLATILNNSNIVISTGPTSAILESLIYNCKLIIYKISVFEEMIINEINLPEFAYNICDNVIEMEKIIIKCLKMKKKFKNLSLKRLQVVKKRLFESINERKLKLLI